MSSKDQIRAEIERLQEMYLVNHDKFKVDDTDLSIFYEGKAKMCGEVLSLLDTLQEPEFPATDEEIETFLASHPKVEVPEKYKTPDWLYKELEQEPEVDGLEEEIEDDLINEADGMFFSLGFYEDDHHQRMLDCISQEQFQSIARYFAEWGRKQVLQEIYDGKVKPVDKITAAWLDDEQNA